MKQISGRQFARLLERRGWELLRVNGSHHIYGKMGETARISVSVHGTKPLKAGLLRHLIKIAEIAQEDLP